MADQSATVSSEDLRLVIATKPEGRQTDWMTLIRGEGEKKKDLGNDNSIIREKITNILLLKA